MFSAPAIPFVRLPSGASLRCCASCPILLPLLSCLPLAHAPKPPTPRSADAPRRTAVLQAHPVFTFGQHAEVRQGGRGREGKEETSSLDSQREQYAKGMALRSLDRVDEARSGMAKPRLARLYLERSGRPVKKAERRRSKTRIYVVIREDRRAANALAPSCGRETGSPGERGVAKQYLGYDTTSFLYCTIESTRDGTVCRKTEL